MLKDTQGKGENSERGPKELNGEKVVGGRWEGEVVDFREELGT